MKGGRRACRVELTEPAHDLACADKQPDWTYPS
jgi:hypothetical protein